MKPMAAAIGFLAFLAAGLALCADNPSGITTRASSHISGIADTPGVRPGGAEAAE